MIQPPETYAVVWSNPSVCRSCINDGVLTLWIYHCHLHPLQVENYCCNSRLVVDKYDLGRNWCQMKQIYCYYWNSSTKSFVLKHVGVGIEIIFRRCKIIFGCIVRMTKGHNIYFKLPVVLSLSVSTVQAIQTVRGMPRIQRIVYIWLPSRSANKNP